MLVILLIFLFSWLLLNLKTSRPDGKLIKVHPYRRLLGFIMPTRNESVVYYDEFIKADNLLKYVNESKKNLPCDITHCLVAATAISIIKNPEMNRFNIGHRLYQRNDFFATFTVKRKKMNKKAKVSAVKLKIDEHMSFYEICKIIDKHITIERSGKKTFSDKEMNLLSILPRPILKGCIHLVKTLDYYNILPYSFIKNDAMYTSTLIANLGSLNMSAGYHHLFEWGTSSTFITAGKIEDKPVFDKDNNKFVPQKTLHLRFSYDERIDDGLTSNIGIQDIKKVLEDPYKHLGELNSKKIFKETINHLSE